MTEYLKNPEATEAAFAHSWFHSGDVGAFDDDGLLWFRDRTKDVIKTGGENVASIEVEKAIYAADRTSPRWLSSASRTSAGARRSPRSSYRGRDHRPGRADRQGQGLIDPYKAPKSVIVLSALPRTSAGKIQKNVVRDEHREHYREQA